ncbi:26538_t:CDS:2, partial [Gigaspora margarita]
VINKDKDGNCEYRALAVSLGRTNNNYKKINKEISWKDDPCAFEYWMRISQMDDIIANTYQGPLYFFTTSESYFYFISQPLNRNEALAIAFVNNNYYVAIVLKPGAPVLQLLIYSCNSLL